MKFINVLTCCVLFVSAINAQQGPNGPPKAPAVNEVVGLKLPPSQAVDYDEGFVSLTAECKGTVKWLVLSTSAKIKFKINQATPNDIDIAIPPFESAISVFCVGAVDGKITEFARTDISVRGPPSPGPPNPPPPPPPNGSGPFHLSIVEDPLRRTPAIRSVVENLELFKQLRAKQITVRVYTVNDPILKDKKFDAVVQRYGAPVMIFQDDTGRALVVSTLPADVAALLRQLSPYVAGGF